MAITGLPEPAWRKPIAFIDLVAQQERIRSRIDAALHTVLDDGNFIMGRQVGELEQLLAAFTGAGNCVTCGNGTDALQLVMMAEGIGPGDGVIIPSFTFVATAEAVMERGASPVFADVDASTFNISVASLKRCVQQAKTDGLKPRAIIAVDLFGLPADYPAIREIAAEEGLVVIADAAQSFGASLNGDAVGTLADYTTTSFYPAKPFGCYGDGGAVFTASEAASELLQSLRFHGRSPDSNDHFRVGLNSRLDTLQAAILIEKLKIFPDEIDRRNTIAQLYGSRLGKLVTVPEAVDGARSVWAQYTLRLPDGVDRARLRVALHNEGVPTAIYYPRPLHQVSIYGKSPRDPEGLATAEQLAESVLSLPMHAYLDSETQDYICAKFSQLLR